ncbi:hypothetical protein KIN20_019760 [Parelaphostrongylus tenuis]|uniref:Uncharacterized protein n=1 Tax=Parelaphostrongylus tenuis TaxID=148309 RepID=A0AAD5N932_PARTN|nr:hypothetical protein KIN20_019760 [Parelaphostrongylus tenuis]
MTISTHLHVHLYECFVKNGFNHADLKAIKKIPLLITWTKNTTDPYSNFTLALWILKHKPRVLKPRRDACLRKRSS